MTSANILNGVISLESATDESLNIAEIQLEKLARKKKLGYVSQKWEKMEIFNLAMCTAPDGENCNIPLHLLSQFSIELSIANSENVLANMKWDQTRQFKSSDYVELSFVELILEYYEVSEQDVSLMREWASMGQYSGISWVSKWVSSFEKELQSVIDFVIPTSGQVLSKSYFTFINNSTTKLSSQDSYEMDTYKYALPLARFLPNIQQFQVQYGDQMFPSKTPL